MAFVQRLINVSFSNGESVSGQRCSVHIESAGAGSSSPICTADLLIYGMTISHMNQLSTLGMIAQGFVPRHTVTVYAGDTQDGMSMVFQGGVLTALSDFQGGPNLPLHVTADANLYYAVKKASPTSINGSSDVAQVISGIAGKMGNAFENNGVSKKVSNPYLPSTLMKQVESIARAAGINWIVEKNILAIWPKDGSRGGGAPLVSPNTGMVGYPSQAAYGIRVRALYDPGFKLGGKIQVKSSITPANGTWTIYHLMQDLESKMPNGQWFTTMDCFNAAISGPPPVAG